MYSLAFDSQTRPSFWFLCSSVLHPFLSEFFYQISSNSFWSFVEAIERNGVKFSSSFTDRLVYETLIKEAEQLLSPSYVGLFKLALRLHFHSPGVAFHERSALETQSILSSSPSSVKCEESWVYINGKIACSSSELQSLLSSHPSLLIHDETQQAIFDSIFGRFPSEHIYNPQLEKEENVPQALLYAPLTSSSFSEFHHDLKLLADQGKIVYIFRHARSSSASNEPLELQGYGVELSLKNTEYKAVDDTNIQKKEKEEGNKQEEVKEAQKVVQSFEEGLLTSVDEQENSEWSVSELQGKSSHSFLSVSSLLPSSSVLASHEVAPSSSFLSIFSLVTPSPSLSPLHLHLHLHLVPCSSFFKYFYILI
jgi:hypothetical protein